MMRRRIAAYAVIVVWASVVGLHVRREYFKPLALQLAEGARMLAPGSYFYTVRMQDVAIGTAATRFDTTATGFVLEDMSTLDVPALDATHRASTRTVLEFDRSLDVRGFQFTLDSSVGRFAVSGLADEEGHLTVQLDAGSAGETSRVRLDRGVLLDAAIPLRLAAGAGFEAGRQVDVRVFDPSTFESRIATIRIVRREPIVVTDSAIYDAQRREWLPGIADTVPAWLLEQAFAGVVIRTWVDDDGRLVRAESPLGFTIERTAFELARQSLERARRDPSLAAGYGVLIEGTAIASNVDVRAVAEADELRVRIGNVELDGFDLAGGRQELRGDTLIIRRERLVPARYVLPYRGDEVAAEMLAPTPLAQADDPAIVAAARAAIGDASDPAVAAWRLNDWIYRNLRKEIVLSVPSARQVLDARRGDCNEHTVLYVAMARAIGLPARTAAGLVHIRGRFYYHAWPEVWLGEWVAVDPTLGQFPADASHLRFVIGGLARQVELVRLIGRLRLEVQ